MLCYPYYAIYAMLSLMCDLCYLRCAVFAILSMLCIIAARPLLCYLSYAVFALLSLLCYPCSAVFAIFAMLSLLCHPHCEVQHLAGEMSGERLHGRQKELIRALGTEAPRRLQTGFSAAAFGGGKEAVPRRSHAQIFPASLRNATEHAVSNTTEHAAERPATEPTHVALECSRSKITIEQATATARATT